MTVASEISRLQCAKSDIRQAIIDKGVDVGASLTLDEYAACINDIPTGGGSYSIDALVVAGGGASGYWGGGGGGHASEQFCFLIPKESEVTVGGGGQVNAYSGSTGGDGGDSIYMSMHAYGGGGGGGTQNTAPGRSGGNGGGAGCGAGGSGIQSFGFIPHSGGIGYVYGGGGGGGAGGDGGNSGGCRYGGGGGTGFYSTMMGKYYGGGGGGQGERSSGGAGSGQGECGGGGHLRTNAGKCGLVVLRYPTDGSYGFTCATGGNCCYTSGGYKYHCFTSNGTFCIVS